MQELEATKVLDQIEVFLNQNKKNQICVFDFFNQKNKLANKVSITDIKEAGFNNLPEYLVYIGSENPEIKTILIEKYKANGSTSKLIENASIKVNLALGEGSPEKSAVTENVAAPPGTNNLKPIETMNSNANNTFSPAIGMNAAVPQHIDLVTRAKEATRLEKENQKLEKKIDKLELKNDDLHAELREAKVDLKTAEKFKDLELLKLGLEKKPFIDKEAGQMVVGVLAPFLQNMIPSGNQAPQQTGMQGVDALSSVKKSLVQEISKPEFTDVMANDLMNIYVLLLDNNPLINQQIATLIQTYNQ